MKASRFSKVIDVILTFVACVLFISALTWFVHTFEIFDLPDFVENVFWGPPKSNGQDEFEQNLLELMEKEPYIDGAYEYVRFTPDKALQLLSSVTPTSDFFWQVETIVSYGDASRTQLYKIYKKGEKVRVDTTEENSDLTTVFSDGITVTVNNRTGDTISFSDDTSFSYSNIINVAALEYVLTTEPVVKDIAIVEIENEKYIYVEVPKKDIDGLDKYFVSLDHGLILYASSSIKGKEYFSQVTSVFDVESVISDNAFELNDLRTEEPLKLQ